MPTNLISENGFSSSKDKEKEFVADANEAFEFVLVRNENELEKNGRKFHPEMSHQIFGENETIFGYKSLEIKLYVAACTLDMYLEVKFEEKFKPKSLADPKPDDIEFLVKSVLPDGFSLCPTLEVFRSRLAKQNEFQPEGEKIHAYSKNREDQSGNFEIYKVTEISEKCEEIFKRMEIFVLFFIDAANFLDLEDKKWIFYITYEKFRSSEGDWCFGFAGYSAIYQYYAYPENIRPRIAHIFVLPPYQRHGHGAQLLQAVNRDFLQNSKVFDITAEDPSENFVFLRDYLNCLNCRNLPAFGAENLISGFKPEMIAEASRMKIGKKQARRVYEILRLIVTPQNDDKMMSGFISDVKRRLNLPFQKKSREFARIMLALSPEEAEASMATMSDAQRTAQVDKMFDQLMQEYRVTASRLAGAPAVSPLTVAVTNGHH